ncbi:hypothetical protein O181_009917 [Austropuccinia psidii MF-1]|uniref:Uncharacterized protein n=1 Tax=Austropuccinia psidii MF-1 TaxID=1389203 RepID=A0A9Q3GKQ7_9BASI|nr:hypothetical protein [Austropuccinia psidii MF-1]
MISKLTELTEYSSSVPLPSVLCGSGIFSQLGSPWSMASSGHFDPSKTYDVYEAVEVLDPACTECFRKGKQCLQPYNTQSLKFHHCSFGKKPFQCPGALISNARQYLWSKKDGPFGREFPVSEAPTPDVTSGYFNLTGSRQRDVARWTNFGRPIPVCGRQIYSSSEVPISRINSQGGTYLYWPPIQCFTFPTFPQKIPKPNNTKYPQKFQPILSTIPSSIAPPSPDPSTARPALVSPVRPSPIAQPRTSQIVTSNSYNLWPGPVEEEKTDHHYRFLLLKYFSKGNFGLSGLPENIKI